jgi:hypothetical protein
VAVEVVHTVVMLHQQPQLGVLVVLAIYLQEEQAQL